MSVLIKIDEKSKVPFFKQIISQVVDLIDSNGIKPGIRMPSTRSMAKKLAVNRSTVYKAYQELWSLGYLESRPGSYTTVRKRKEVASKHSAIKKDIISWSDKLSPGIQKAYSSYVSDGSLLNQSDQPDVINFIPLSPDSRLLPSEDFRRCINHVLVKKGADLLQYGSPLGFYPLREFISERMREHSISVSTDDIMITAGAQNAIELILRLLTQQGDTVVIETPTYSRVIDMLHMRNLKIIEIPMSQQGLSLNHLESELKKNKPALIYTIPNFHNPTGITTDQNHREKLLMLCERHSIPLVEDGFEEEMKYFGRTVLPVKSMDHNGIVMYIGTFSKVLFPGIRIGWIAADKSCIDYLGAVQWASIISPNLLSQAALHHFCKKGYFELHIKRLHRVYRKRMHTALNAIQQYLDNPYIEYTRPTGGYTIWFTLNGLHLSETDLFEHLMKYNVAVLPGHIHFHTLPNKIFFRISIGHVGENEIEEGIQRIAKGLFKLYNKN